ncbi:response regulator transcription factor [Cryobacterium sp. MLB-32]|uniref:response regulator transcription factor n=1 Tax=Cryobacterium sp. MLB-32 TaxID=1529318 RepID=UPI00068DF3E8|nr:response regulator transcription factor [Cryobacterium sp. MLB-32]
MRILIVNSDPEQSDVLDRVLRIEGYATDRVATGIDALITSARPQIALAIISVDLGQMSGFEVCRRLRQAGNTIPVLLLGGSTPVIDRVFGLDSGADDFLCEPFDVAELAARVRALLRRSAMGRGRRYQVGGVVLDTWGHAVTVAGRRVSLSPKEASLFRLLCLRVGSTVDRASILAEVWDGTADIDPNIVDQYISYLRRKIDPDDAGVRILTMRGRGYTLQVAPSNPQRSPPETGQKAVSDVTL